MCSPVQAAEDWLSNEVLQQLHDLRGDIRGLKSEVYALKKEIASLKGEIGKSARQGMAAAPSTPEKIIVGAAPNKGNKNAKVAVIEFSDFQCPYCGRHYRQTFPDLERNYIKTGKILYIAKDFPLSFHKGAMSAAVAARCSGKQGKYWEMHDVLFENQRQLNNEFYKKQAAVLRLNIKNFESCLKDPEQEKLANKELAEGEHFGVRGTPAFFIGHIKDGVVTDIQPLSGAQPYERFAKIVDGLLK